MIECLETLRSAAASSGKSPMQIADEAGLSRMTVVNILTGKNENPSLQTLMDIAAVLNFSVDLVPGDAEQYVSAESLAAVESAHERTRAELSVTVSRCAAAETHCDFLKSELAEKEKSYLILRRIFGYVICSMACAIMALTLVDLSNVDNGWLKMPLTSRLAIVLFVAVVIVLAVMSCMMFINIKLLHSK